MFNKRTKRCLRTRPACAPFAQRGLTLIELLVAISILAFVAVLGWRGLDGIVRARVSLTGDLEQTRGMQLAFAQLQSDCAHLVSAAALPARSPLATEPGRLTLVRTVFADNQPGKVQVVTYRVKDGVLTRRESTATRDLGELDNLWLTAVGDSDKTHPVVLQTGVAAMRTRLWSAESNGWQTGDADAAPSGVPRVTSHSVAMGPNGGSNQRGLTGLEVALQLQGRETSMLKVFLLGAM
jgi:general secretion pathway protein J